MKNSSLKKNNNEDPFVIQEGGFKYGKLEDFSYKLGWADDSFDVNKDRSEVVGMIFDFSKLKFVVAFLIFFMSILIGRVAWLQVIKGDYYYSMAEGNRIRERRIESKRGVIYDRNFNILARNVANFLLYVIPADLPSETEEKNKVLDKIKNILTEDDEGQINFDYNEFETELNKIEPGSLEAYSTLFVADNIDYEKAMFLYLELDSMPGVFLSNKTRREYNLYSMSLAHVLGYTGKINAEELKEYGEEYLPIDYIGKTGIEYFWENELKGINGEKYVEVDALGNEKKIISVLEAEDGHNLVLSLDVILQKKAEEILIKYLEELELSKASVIIMDPNNGEILTLISFPSYNNNVFARGITQAEYDQLINHPDRPLFNRSISGEYPSGSTIKPIMAVGALEDRIISENTSFLSTGGLRISQWYFPDWKVGGHGSTDVRKAIAESVNTFFYYIGGGYDDFQGLGLDRIVHYYKLFGLGTQTGIDLVGEADGFVPTAEWKEEVKGERWYIGDTYHISIGQGDVLVTPLQVANFTSFFANGGSLYQPHLIKNVLSGDDKLLQTVESNPVRSDFLDDYNIEVVRQGMRRTVTSGSAVSLSTLPVTAAGKTGTAQWSTQKDPHAWFTGFAPYENPELVITVLVEEGEEGSSVATPIAREILQWYFGEYKN